MSIRASSIRDLLGHGRFYQKRLIDALPASRSLSLHHRNLNGPSGSIPVISGTSNSLGNARSLKGHGAAELLQDTNTSTWVSNSDVIYVWRPLLPDAHTTDSTLPFWKEWNEQSRKLIGQSSKLRENIQRRNGRSVTEQVGPVDGGEILNNRWMWDQLTWSERYRILPDILKACLLESAAVSVHVVSALPNFFMSHWVRLDCLFFLKVVYRDEIESDPEVRTLFLQQLAAERLAWNQPLSQMDLRHLTIFIEYCSPKEITELVEKHLDDVPSSANMVFLLVDCFTKHGDVDRAIHFLGLLPTKMLLESSPEVLQRCTNILKLDTVETYGDTPDFKLLPQLLKLGIRPNKHLHAMILQNAFAAGMSAVGWDVYRYMQAENAETDGHIYMALLKDAFGRKDVQRLNEVLSDIHKRDDLSRNAHLVAYTMNLVRIISIRDRNDNTLTALSHMWAIYDRAFSRAILVKLRMASDQISTANPGLLHPSPDFLCFIIWAYILAHRRDPFVRALWLRIHDLIREGDAIILEVVKSEIIFNAFLVFYSRHADSLVSCLDILQFMLDNEHCQPTAKTWTILIAAFLRHGQHEAAEKMRRMMADRNIIPAAKEWKYVFGHWPSSSIALRAKEALEAQEMSLETEAALNIDPVSAETKSAQDNASAPGWDNKSSLKDWDGLVDFKLGLSDRATNIT